MGFSSLHVCMESSSSDHWLQGTIQEECAGGGMDSSPSPMSSGDHHMIACSRAMVMTESRKLRPPQDQALKCPRCDSTHTKFCYYNNYSLSQPRYFCKACRRYWTKGGTLRNIPVGGGCRKNKKVSSKNKSNDQQPPIINNNHQNQLPSYLNNHPKDQLQLSNFQDVQFSHHINNLLASGANAGALMGNHNNFMESKYNIGMLENPIRHVDFFGMMSSDVGGVGDMNGYNYNNVLPLNYQGFCSSSSSSGFGGMSLDGNNNNSSGSYMMESFSGGDHSQNSIIDVKPNPRLLSLEWQDMMQGRSDGYLNGSGSWTGLMNGYGSSTANPLV